jgi:DNA-binding NtrC family response regulator
MTATRLALASDDPRLSGAIQAQLKKNLGQSLLATSLEGIRGQLIRATDGLLVIATTGEQAEPVAGLVQEVYLQQLVPVLVVVAGPIHPILAGLLPRLAGLLSWPDDGDRVVQMVRERLGEGREPRGARPDTVEEVIAHRLVLHTPSLLPLVERLALAAIHDVTVLLTGETGTGKTWLARLLHDCSPRHKEPFLPVPCGAIPANLLESAFFGHARGAFTGATERKVGKFEAVGNGTILLDEIDTLPLEHQPALLRVIETGEFEPVGSNETRHCTARIIVASNWDLERAVREHRFREDLYYRLNVMSFHLPPLRERVQDISPLVRGLMARFTPRFRKGLFDIDLRALEALETYPWPGNIRQLENALQQAVLLSSGPDLRLEHLPQQIRDHQSTSPAAPPTDSLEASRAAAEKRVIQRALESNGYSRTRAAAALGISRVTLYKKMKKHRLMELPLRPE